MNYLNKLIRIFSGTLLLIFFVLPTGAFAANLDFVPNTGTYKVGDMISVKIITSSPDKAINAVSSNISFSKNTLSLTSISKVTSIISLWAQDPSFSNSTGTANLEGVILNGYTGSFGTVATLNFKVIAPGNTFISFNEASVLANDGEGTNVLTGKNSATYTIIENFKKQEQIIDTTVIDKVKELPAKKDTNNISIEEIRSNIGNKIQTRFIITSVDKDPNVPYNIQIDSSDVYEWNDPNGSHIYETIPLTYGPHLIKVTTKDNKGNALSIYKNFVINGLAEPTVTEYPNSLIIGDTFSIKGIADPNMTVVFSINKIENGKLLNINEAGTAITNEDGVFNFNYKNPVTKGTYIITLTAKNDAGLESAPTEAIRINVKENNLSIWQKITEFLTVFIPAFGLFIIVIFILTYAIYRFRKFRISLKKDLSKTESLIKKSFSLLDEDMKQEIEIFKKVKNRQSLTAKDKEFISGFKKDLEEAEGLIVKELRDVERDVEF
jgi:hypothetical protein